mmetsp:Transcript_77584/g.222210  ORF Transcript_77584/g.222210 Transcript_77584/m.222210 type:complete len:279 (-) Transcript_77584:198-1034(-)
MPSVAIPASMERRALLPSRQCQSRPCRRPLRAAVAVCCTCAVLCAGRLSTWTAFVSGPPLQQRSQRASVYGSRSELRAQSAQNEKGIKLEELKDVVTDVNAEDEDELLAILEATDKKKMEARSMWDKVEAIELKRARIVEEESPEDDELFDQFDDMTGQVNMQGNVKSELEQFATDWYVEKEVKDDPFGDWWRQFKNDYTWVFVGDFFILVLCTIWLITAAVLLYGFGQEWLYRSFQTAWDPWIQGILGILLICRVVGIAADAFTGQDKAKIGAGKDY